MMVYVIQYFVDAGGIGEALDLNVFNFTFIALGLYLHHTPQAFMQAIRDATEGAAGIILQFPLYTHLFARSKARPSRAFSPQ